MTKRVVARTYSGLKTQNGKFTLRVRLGIAASENFPRAPADRSGAYKIEARHEIEVGDSCPGHAVKPGPGRAKVGRPEHAAQCANIQNRRYLAIAARGPIDGNGLAAQFLRKVAIDRRPCPSVAHPNVKKAAEVGRVVVAPHERTSDREVVVGISRAYLQVHDSLVLLGQTTIDFGPRAIRIAVVPGGRCLENAAIFSANEDCV